MPLKKLNPDFNANIKSHVADLRAAMAKLHLISEEEKNMSTKKIDESLKKAIIKYKELSGLESDINLDKETVERINISLHDNFISENKIRTAKLHSLFEKINIEIDKKEKKNRNVGSSTRNAIKKLQRKYRLKPNGKLSEELFEKLQNEAITMTYKTKTKQSSLLTKLQKVSHIAKLNIDIAPAELKNKKIGRTAISLIKAIQEKYNLPQTGKIDKETLYKISSIASSKGTKKKYVKKPQANKLKTISKELRLNMVNPEVGEMQKSLVFLGYKIEQKEYNSNTFGKTTIRAIEKFQQDNHLSLTKKYDKPTAKVLIQKTVEAYPKAQAVHQYRIKGSVRDEMWKRKSNMVVKVYELNIDGSEKELAAKKVFLNGFFDLSYDAPISKTKVDKFHIIVKLFDNLSQNKSLAEQKHYDVNRIHWVNFTARKNEEGEIIYDGAFLGSSEFEATKKIITEALGNKKIETLKESPEDLQITNLSFKTRIEANCIMSHVLSVLATKSLKNANFITEEVLYAFISQNLPSDLPGDLLRGSSDWETIDQLVENTTSGIVFLDSSIQKQTLKNANEQNLVSQYVILNLEEIIQELEKYRQEFILDKPILAGNANLSSLLQEAKIANKHYDTIAGIFIQKQGVNDEFWDELNKTENNISQKAINDLTIVVEAGNISINHLPTIQYIKNNTGAGKPFKKVKDIAKISTKELENLIKDNGKKVPENMPGETINEKVENFAASIKARNEVLYPTESLIGEVKRSNTTQLDKIIEVEKFIDKQENLKIKEQNIDEYIIEENITIKPKVLEQLKVLQRNLKITSNPVAGSVLIDEGLHSSMQIYFKGKNAFGKAMKTKGVDDKIIDKVYESSKTQYMQILARLMDFRKELHLNTPAAIIPHAFDSQEIKDTIGNIPNLEMLFGSLDYCECEHCKSVYGPAAYLADMLRYINEHDSLVTKNGKKLKVKDILFDRRPDLGKINLNCENTNTVLPYVDLVCEILENNIKPRQKDFKYQSTLSSEELKAMPEYIRPHAYDILAKSDFPMNSAFNLGQEETRAYLNFLRVPRYELMDAFQNKSNPASQVPTNELIAAEYFETSFKEKDLIVKTQATVNQQKKYWGTKIPGNSKIAVSDFLLASKLTYYELMELLLVKFVNDPTTNKSEIERPIETCDTSVQLINNITVQKLDLMHRFIRLWRKTGWEMWELDLLIRNTKIGNKKINGQTLVNLKSFKQLQEDTKLSFEILLTFYGEINREIRIDPEKSDIIINPLYNNLFQNSTITKPIDTKFKAIDSSYNPIPIQSGITLDSTNTGGYTPVPIILSALAISQSDFDLLKAKTDNKLSVDSLSILLKYNYLAKSLKITIKELILLLSVTRNTDPFPDTQTTVKLTEYYEHIKASGLSLYELDYIINYNIDSSVGLREKSYTQYIESLQKAILAGKDTRESQVKSQIAVSYSLTDEQAGIILENISISGKTLLERLSDEELTKKQTDGTYKTINTTNFQKFYDDYFLLHKVSIIINNMKIKTENLKWFIKNHASVHTLDFSLLPTGSTIYADGYKHWQNLYLFLQFASIFPEPENASIRTVLDLAINPVSTENDIQKEIAELTQWDVDELKDMANGLGVKDGNTTNEHYLDYHLSNLYNRLKTCFEQKKLLGVNSILLLKWANITGSPTTDLETAQETRQAVKSKYEQEDWLEKIKPIYDEIREKKRKALVEYLMEDSQRNENPVISGNNLSNPLYWKDTNTLYNYFLIDVEMKPCQLTSRIKQALSSVQLYVQRCFLNLENLYVKVTQDDKEDVSSPNAWSQWKWMKNYRIWEANRKVFMYPENWIEPELRDDKSSFFKELESQLAQNELNKENVEEAFAAYLQKMDEVSHLKVCGLYHQMEDLNTCETGYELNIVHVIGRTKELPNVYYYRTYNMNYDTWSAWDRIDVEITGEHIMPVVYNRKLHLFWLEFMQKPMKAKKMPAAKATTGPTDTPEPMSVMEVQLGWTIKKTAGWSTKKISKQKLIHPWERPISSYNLKPYYLSKFNELYLDIYLSTSKEFNDRDFYDPNKAYNPSSSNDYLKNPTKLTKNRFNETYLPWHSSSFVFNGEVKEIKLKALKGKYVYSYGSFSIDYQDSFKYVNNRFEEDGKNIEELDVKHEYGPRLKLPTGMHYKYNALTNNKVHAKNTNNLRVLEGNTTKELLLEAGNTFDLFITQQDLQLNTNATHPFFYQDNQRAFFIKPEWKTRMDNYGKIIGNTRKYRFLPFYHPYTTLFIREFNRDGMDGLMNRKVQTKPENYPPKNNFKFSAYCPVINTIIDETAKTDIVDFSFSGANSIYNWELFFHAPMMIACRLMQNQKFEDAMQWFHYIFDPSNVGTYPTPQRYWITKPFFEYNSEDYKTQRIESILSNLLEEKNKKALIAWKNDPFKPHLIARYRPVAYQKNVVMKYLDNLISWGDMLFKRDTIESINEASLLYMLAYEILGERPKKVPTTKREHMTFNELEDKLDSFANAKVDVVIEDTLLPVTVITTSSSSSTEAPPKLEMFYFCIPNNDFLDKYWDTVEDRLFKIRNCMNISGVVRQLALFEPPIDPALLVKAAAAGVDISSVLSDSSVSASNYRFQTIIQKAMSYCNEVKGLGEKLLSALEKKDSEHLSVIVSQNEVKLLEAGIEVRKKQIEETKENVNSLNQSIEIVKERKTFYEDREYMNTAEIIAMSLSAVSTGLDAAIAIGYILAGGLKLIPTFLAGAAGFGGSPEVNASMGGQQIGNGAEMAVQTIRSIAAALDKGAAIASTVGSYDRRQEEWDHLAAQASMEEKQIEYQIKASQLRQAISEKEYDNHKLNVDNKKTTLEYMKNKYTNEQLYNWMISQIATTFFQAYQLAFDIAKKAEKCYQKELGISSTGFIQFGYWDSLKKGLLSGDKLMSDLHKLEADYINQNSREFEITKNISLAQMFPLALISLIETGTCTLSLPEWLFDMDYPGHYMRRIKNVSVSIPCVVGPNTSINCTLSILKNEIRQVSTGSYARLGATDSRFGTMFETISSIATSHGQNDTGMFELNFNDERYLPFEHAGAISDWKIDMPKENNHFDFSSLADVILHIQYTSRSGGGTLAQEANTYLQANLPSNSARLFSLKSEFPNEWHQFFNPIGSNDQELILEFKAEHFFYYIRSKISSMKIKQFDMFIEKGEQDVTEFKTNVKITSAASADNLTVSKDASYNNTHHLSRDLSSGSPNAIGELKIKLKDSTATDFKSLTKEQIGDIYILVHLKS